MAGFSGSPPGLSTDPLWAASGDIVYATGDDASSVLAIGSAGYVLTVNCDSTLKWAAGFTGPACSTDNAIPTFHGTGGATFQDTTVTISDSNVLTADAGIVVDNLTVNCCAITATSGFTVDATGDIVFDADGDDITFKAGSDDSTGLAFTNSGGTWTVKAGTSNSDLIFNVNDGGVDTKVMAIDGGDSVVTFGGNSVKSGEIRILEDTDNGANYTAFKVGNMAANVTYTLPTNVAASCGLFLKSTCAGVLSWAAAGGGLCSNADAIIHNCYGIVIGHTGVLASADHPANTVGEFTMIGAAGGDTGVHIIRHSADAGGGAIRFAKSRNATVASHTKVNSGDTLGEISWFGCDGGDFQPFAATIKVLVDGSPCTNDMPGRMEFSTTKDGAESPTLAMNIASTQEITVHSLKSGSSATTSVQSGLAKAWIVNVADVSGGSGCGLDSYNVSVSECATGVRLYTFGTDFGSANYVAVGSAGAPAGCNLQAPIFGQNTRTAGSICMLSRSSGGGNVDVISFNAFFGDQ